MKLRLITTMQYILQDEEHTYMLSPNLSPVYPSQGTQPEIPKPAQRKIRLSGMLVFFYLTFFGTFNFTRLKRLFYFYKSPIFFSKF